MILNDNNKEIPIMILNDYCYLDNNHKKIIKFNSEIKLKEIPIDKKIYEKLFMQKNNINFLNLKLSNISIYSITKPNIGKYICKIIVKLMKTQNIIITDAVANVGGMSIIFSNYFNSVNSCEIIQLHCNMLYNNLQIYNLQDKVRIYCGDYFDVMFLLKQDIIFFDPPWDGPSYKNNEKMSLGLNNINICCIINNLLNNAKYILLYAPYNYNQKDLQLIKSSYKIVKLNKYKINSHILIIIKGLII